MKHLVLLSGGIDSAVALAHSEAELALSFNYGQTHLRELDAARVIARHYQVEHHVIDLRDALDLPCALTGHGDLPEMHAEQPDATVVPGRNLVMLAVAAAWANAWKYQTVVIGANSDDSNGYMDCRAAFLGPLNEATLSGYEVGVWAPFTGLNKREVVEYGRTLDVPIELTWSCYRGGAEPCERCGACQCRSEALA